MNSNLVTACYSGNIDEIQKVINCGVSIKTVLNLVCLFGHLDVLKWLIESIDVRASDDVLFRHVCYHGHLKVAKWLLSIEPSINPRANADYAFCWTCCNGHLRVAKWLLSVEASIGKKISNQPFYWACTTGNDRTAKWLQRIDFSLKYKSLQDFKARRVMQLVSFF
jgi:hypothetical protein